MGLFGPLLLMGTTLTEYPGILVRSENYFCRTCPVYLPGKIQKKPRPR